MSENKFIKRLKGEQTAKSVLEIKNESAKTSFANMPQGTSNAINVYSDHRGNATAVLNGTTNWKVSNSELLLVDTVSGDGQDFTSTYTVIGTGLWVNASYTFPSTGDPRHPVAMVFNPSTKWVLKVCGDSLIVDGGSTADFTMLIKIGTSNVYSKNFTIPENAGQFSKEFIIDFGEANSDIIKAGGLSTLTVQLLCGTPNASARIYNGMSVLTCLQRKVDASAVSNLSANVEDVLDGNIIPSDYFSNPAFIDQIEDGDTAVAIFARDGDDVNLDHWEQPIPDRTGNAGKFLQTPDGDKMSWEDVEISDVTGLQTELNGLQGQITTNKNTMDSHIGNTNNPHSVTKAQVGLGNVDNTSDLDKPISTATQAALDLKIPISTKYGAALSLTINSTTYVVTAQLKDQDGNNLGTAQTIDLPLESVVVSGAYDSVTKEVVLTLQDGSKIRFSVADLVSGLQTEITALNMLDADLVDDTTSTHKFVTTTEKSTWSSKQDAISDLTTIRSGAAAGATAVQPADLATVATSGSYNDLLNKPTIPTVNNSTITITQGGVTKGSFTLNQASGDTIALDAGGGVGNIDNVTITVNADQEIQAVAVIDQNTGIAKTWTGTMAEYDAIATKDPETEYIITDDIGGSATEIGEITEELNNKSNIDLDNLTSTGKEKIVAFGMPDYASVIAADGVASGTWIQCSVDSFVCTWGSDGYAEDYYAYVSPDKSTKYVVGRRYDDQNGYTQATSFTFFVPKGWWFQNNPENGFSYRIYPLKGVA